jgi:hypothetical protein
MSRRFHHATSSRVPFTEDTVEMKLGEGLWKNISGLEGAASIDAQDFY